MNGGQSATLETASLHAASVGLNRAGPYANRLVVFQVFCEAFVVAGDQGLVGLACRRADLAGRRGLSLRGEVARPHDLLMARLVPSSRRSCLLTNEPETRDRIKTAELNRGWRASDPKAVRLGDYWIHDNWDRLNE